MQTNTTITRIATVKDVVYSMATNDLLMLGCMEVFIEDITKQEDCYLVSFHGDTAGSLVISTIDADNTPFSILQA
jgi:hypothetical protein